jgi:hypothetical protein
MYLLEERHTLRNVRDTKKSNGCEIRAKMKDSMEDKFFPMTSITSGIGQVYLQDIYYLPIQVVNVCFIGNRDELNEWVLVDAGMP